MYTKENFKKDLFYAIGADAFWHVDRWMTLLVKVEKVGIMAESPNERRYYRWMCEEIDHTAELDDSLEKLVNDVWQAARLKVWREIVEKMNK